MDSPTSGAAAAAVDSSELMERCRPWVSGIALTAEIALVVVYVTRIGGQGTGEELAWAWAFCLVPFAGMAGLWSGFRALWNGRTVSRRRLIAMILGGITVAIPWLALLWATLYMTGED